MSSYAGQDLFSSGPHAFRLGPWQRDVQRRSLPGVNGEVLLDMGLRSRPIVQTGRLQAPSAEELHQLLDAVNRWCDGGLHALVDNHGRSYPRTLLEKFLPTGPVESGRGFHCDYQIEYRQLP